MTRSASSSRTPLPVRMVDFRLSVGTRILLDDTNVEFPAGGVSLIVGPSGAGKTMLLYALAGLLGETPEIRIAGKILLGDHDVTNEIPRTDFGIVFQQFALFDDFTPRGNVRFALEHRRRPALPHDDRSPVAANKLLEQLGVPQDVPVSRLSGGQQQRLAVARTLAYQPDVILYDEPTSGLDAASAHNVAQLIRHTRSQFGITSIVVTHDYDVLPAVADAVFLFDTQRHTLTPVPHDRWDDLRNMLLAEGQPEAACAIVDRNATTAPGAGAGEPTPASAEATGATPETTTAVTPSHSGRSPDTTEVDAAEVRRHDRTEARRPSDAAHGTVTISKHGISDARPSSDGRHPASHRSVMVSVWGERFRTLVKQIHSAAWQTGSLVLRLLELPWWLFFSWLRFLANWRRLKWCARFLAHYTRVVGGLSAHIYLAVMGFLIGFVTTYFTFEQFPYREFTRPLLIENLLQAIGFLLYRVLVPLLATVLIAARCGAAVASDLGAKSYGRQLHAMRSFGVRPPEYLLTGTLWAFLLGTPWLTLVAFGVARITSRAVFAAMFPQHGTIFWDLYFHWELRSPDHVLYAGTNWLLAKLTVCALGTALIAYQAGTAPKESSGEVRSAITTTILWSTLWVLVTHFAFTFHEFDAYQQ
ncbi:MAG: ATP-binding cassette domain-containing protein [Planctomycetota bacterium]|nr:MAG: ATP-binding cassette domain-containing protein [Planctomycetota bacterium]